jgi:hypothetical protein
VDKHPSFCGYRYDLKDAAIRFSFSTYRGACLKIFRFIILNLPLLSPSIRTNQTTTTTPIPSTLTISVSVPPRDVKMLAYPDANCPHFTVRRVVRCAKPRPEPSTVRTGNKSCVKRHLLYSQGGGKKNGSTTTFLAKYGSISIFSLRYVIIVMK